MSEHEVDETPTLAELVSENVRLWRENDALRAKVERLRDVVGILKRECSELEEDAAFQLRIRLATEAEVERLRGAAMRLRGKVEAMADEVERLRSYRVRADELRALIQFHDGSRP